MATNSKRWYQRARDGIREQKMVTINALKNESLKARSERWRPKMKDGLKE